MTSWTKLTVVLAVAAAIVTAMTTTGVSAFDPAVSVSSAVALTTGEAEAMAKNLSKAYGSPLLVPASAFRSDGINPDQLRFQATLGILQGQNTANAYAMAPVYLPNGATVASIMASVFDGLDGAGAGCENPIQQDVNVWVFRLDNNTGEALQMAVFGTSGMNGDIQHLSESSVDYPGISYPGYSYFAVTKVCHSAHAFHNLQIWYAMD